MPRSAKQWFAKIKYRVPNGTPSRYDQANVLVRPGAPQVESGTNNDYNGEDRGNLHEDDSRSSDGLRALRAIECKGTELNLKDLLSLFPKYAGCGQGSPRSLLQHVLIGEGVPFFFGGVLCVDNMENIRQLLNDLSQGDIVSLVQASNRLKVSVSDNAFDYDDFNEGTFIIRNRAYAFVSQVGPKMWSASFDFIGEDLNDWEVKAFEEYKVREEAKKDPTQYQHIWMLVDYGNNDLNFHDKKVPLSNFKPENYSETNRQWMDKLTESLFKPTTTGRLTVFQGAAGTGKTRFLRALMQKLGNNVCPVVLPVNLASDLSNPRMLGVLTGNSDFEDKHVLLIIEDGDGLLEKRERANSVISDFLNVVDGLIGEVVNLHIVVTTNLQRKDFDPAITRPGRLHSILYFEALDYAQANVVYKRETGEDLAKTQDTYTLAEVYALAQDHNNGLRKKMTPATGQGQYL